MALVYVIAREGVKVVARMATKFHEVQLSAIFIATMSRIYLKISLLPESKQANTVLYLHCFVLLLCVYIY